SDSWLLMSRPRSVMRKLLWLLCSWGAASRDRSQKCLLHRRVVAQRISTARPGDAAGFHEVAALGDAEARLDVLFDHQQGNAGLLNAGEGGEEFTGDDGREAKTGFIQHQQARTAHQGAADGQHLL